MKKILMIDVSSIFYRAFVSLNRRLPDAVDQFGINCAGTYGFFTSFFRAIKEYGPFDEYVFAIDAKGSTANRKSIEEKYKSNREATPSSYYVDKDNLIKNYLPLLNIVPLGLYGYEADDIIASSCRYVAENYESNGYEIYIMSGDKDLEQCVQYTSRIKFIKTQPKWELLTYKDIMERWNNIDTKDISIIKAICGDGSDCISGIRGYKLKKALKVYKNEKFLEEHRDIITKNLTLIKLRDELDAVPRGIDLSMESLNKCFTKLNSFNLLKRLPKILAS